MKKLLLLGISMALPLAAIAQINRIDVVRHDAPELSGYGSYDIGVRTMELIDLDRPDILATVNGAQTQYYDRELTVEIWYPAQLEQGQNPGGEYSVITRNPKVMATLQGRAVRDASPLTMVGSYPLVIISHGYPGNRFLMSHLGENLASKGYVTVSIDHTDSTYDDQQAFASTLYNRPLDQRFVLNEMDRMTKSDTSFLQGIVDTESVGVVGYSMGGYGLVNNLGGGFNNAMAANENAPPNGLLRQHSSGNVGYRDNLDPRIKAGIAVAPWGMNAGFWLPEDLAGVTVPALYIAGDLDRVAGYEEGVRAIFEHAVNSDRYLLTYENAGHNAGAPIPLPVEIRDGEDQTGAGHYTDPVWDNVRMNNILNHFATVYFDYYLNDEQDAIDYLQLVPNSADGFYSEQENQNTYWKGFARGTANGLILEHLSPGQ